MDRLGDLKTGDLGYPNPAVTNLIELLDVHAGSGWMKTHALNDACFFSVLFTRVHKWQRTDAEGDKEDWGGENKEPISVLDVTSIKIKQLETRLHQADNEADRGGDHNHQEGVEPV